MAAHGIKVYEIATIDGISWSVAVPGAHIDLALLHGGVRQYSLLHLERSVASYGPIIAIRC